MYKCIYTKIMHKRTWISLLTGTTLAIATCTKVEIHVPFHTCMSAIFFYLRVTDTLLVTSKIKQGCPSSSVYVRNRHGSTTNIQMCLEIEIIGVLILINYTLDGYARSFHLRKGILHQRRINIIISTVWLSISS